jgi:aldose 1-epimerase
MYKLEEVNSEGQKLLRLINPVQGIEALIYPDAGASMQYLSVAGKEIIGLPDLWAYDSCYASALLFPFANRVEHATYNYKGNTHHLTANEVETGHAIHGLVAKSSFTMDKFEQRDNKARLEFSYTSSGQDLGFSFLFEFKLVYLLGPSYLKIEFQFLNTGHHSFPFTFGWHPYFRLDEASKHTIRFSGVSRALIDESGITRSMVLQDSNPVLDWAKTIDDCFLLRDSVVHWNSNGSNYSLEMDGMDYIQLFSVPGQDYVAIEPVSAPSNSFNNEIGLRHLEPERKFTSLCKLSWI